MELNGKVALVTGGSRGIGAGIALKLAQDGYTVAVNYQSSASAAQNICDQIKEFGGTAKAYAGDVSDSASVESMFAAIEADFGGVDLLVNNAGVVKDGFLMMMSDDQWDSVLDTNLKGCFLASRLAVRHMMRQRSGNILNIVSVSGLIGTEGQANYSASKGGVIAMTRTLARELGRYGIRVNAIAPGFIETEMTDDLSENKHTKEIIKRIPLRRMGSVEEVANMASFITSDLNSYMTGQTIVMDGGLSV